MICIIAAMGDNRVIGSAGKIPWHLPEDFKRFKAITMGHPVIMGRKTFASIGKPLPGRTNIVITRDPDYAAPGVLVAHSLEQAFDEARKAAGAAKGVAAGAVAAGGVPAAEGVAANKIFVLGGAEIYAAALPKTDMIYLTHVRGVFEGDAFFPAFDEAAWELISSEEWPKDEKNAYEMAFLAYRRKV